MMMNNYMGLVDPLDTTWADGRSVTVYPNGKVVDRNSGYLIRNADYDHIYTDEHDMQNKIHNSNVPINNNMLIFGGIIIVAIVALVYSRGR